MNWKPVFAQAKPPASPLMAEPVFIEGSADEVDAIRKQIRQGRALLRVVSYPWGVEFDVCDAEGGP